MPGRIRAFFALALEGAALAAALRCLEALRGGPLAGSARFVRPEGLHVTLRFLGAVPPEALPPLVAAVGEELREVPCCPVRLGALLAFPSSRRPRVLALDLEPAESLGALAAAVERGVVSAGFAPEPRPFRAHVTLARVREGRRLPGPGPDVPAPGGAFEAREVVLFESRPGAGGSVYTPLERLPLRGPVPTQP